MCGRIACTLEPHVIQNACTYVDPKTGVYRKPEWREHPTGKENGGSDEVSNRFQYHPSANQAPTSFSPVLFRDKASEEQTRVLQPMMWSLIPPWHKGDAKSHGMATNNCRIEGLADSKLFRQAVKKRNFCVIVAQGFYEWKTVKVESGKKPEKQPYLIIRSQDKEKFSSDDVADEARWNEATWSEKHGWDGPKLIMMAGIYDVWKDLNDKPIYSYSVITMESGNTLSWLHHRMPAILETEEQVEAWVNPPSDCDISELLGMLKPATALDWYTVSPKVNNSRCHDIDCIKRVENVPKEKPKTLLTSWLKISPKKEAKKSPAPANAEVNPTCKKPKLEVVDD